MEPLFQLGQCVVTASAQAVLLPSVVRQLLERHARGDWGELEKDDLEQNQRALREGLRLFSRYTVGARIVYVISESDRSSTTVLFAEDY